MKLLFLLLIPLLTAGQEILPLDGSMISMSVNSSSGFTYLSGQPIATGTYLELHVVAKSASPMTGTVGVLTAQESYYGLDLIVLEGENIYQFNMGSLCDVLYNCSGSYVSYNEDQNITMWAFVRSSFLTNSTDFIHVKGSFFFNSFYYNPPSTGSCGAFVIKMDYLKTNITFDSLNNYFEPQVYFKSGNATSFCEKRRESYSTRDYQTCAETENINTQFVPKLGETNFFPFRCLREGFYTLLFDYTAFDNLPNGAEAPGSLPFRISYIPDTENCTNGCSGNGYCLAGTCSCTTDYIGNDCSIIKTTQLVVNKTTTFNYTSTSDSLVFSIKVDQAPAGSNIEIKYTAGNGNTGNVQLYRDGLPKLSGEILSIPNFISDRSPSVFDICPSSFTNGTILYLRIKNGDPFSGSFTYNYVQRNVNIGSSVQIQPLTNFDFTYASYFLYRVKGPFITNLTFTVESQEKIKIGILDGDSCTQDNFIYHDRLKYLNTSRGITTVIDTQTISPSWVNQKELYVAIYSPSSLITLSVYSDTGCGDCGAGFCSSGSCYCPLGFTGANCDQLTSDSIALVDGVLSNVTLNQSVLWSFTSDRPFYIYYTSSFNPADFYLYTTIPYAIRPDDNTFLYLRCPGDEVVINAINQINVSFQVEAQAFTSPILTYSQPLDLYFKGFTDRVQQQFMFPVSQGENQTMKVTISYTRSDQWYFYFLERNGPCTPHFTEFVSNNKGSLNSFYNFTTGLYYDEYTLDSCAHDRFINSWLVVSSRYGQTNFNITVQVDVYEDTERCPNCCSRIGTCNLESNNCSCPVGYTGDDCSIPTCVSITKPNVCGLQSGSYAINPYTERRVDKEKVPVDFQCPVSDIADFVLNKYNDSFEFYNQFFSEILASPDTGYSGYFVGPQCRNALLSLLCRSVVLPCSGKQISLPASYFYENARSKCPFVLYDSLLTLEKNFPFTKFTTEINFKIDTLSTTGAISTSAVTTSPPRTTGFASTSLNNTSSSTSGKASTSTSSSTTGDKAELSSAHMIGLSVLMAFGALLFI